MEVAAFPNGTAFFVFRAEASRRAHGLPLLLT